MVPVVKHIFRRSFASHCLMSRAVTSAAIRLSSRLVSDLLECSSRPISALHKSNGYATVSELTCLSFLRPDLAARRIAPTLLGSLIP